MLALLTLAILPIAMNAQDRQRVDPCERPEALRAPEGWGHESRFGTLPPRRSTKWWSEGFVSDPGAQGRRLRFAVVRSQRPSRLYLQPHAFVDEAMEPDITRVIELVGLDGKPFPAWISTQRRPPWTRIMIGVYIWEREPTASPLGVLARNALPDLIEGTPPLEFLAVSGVAHDEERRGVRERLEQWLRESWDRYQQVCGRPGAPAT